MTASRNIAIPLLATLLAACAPESTEKPSTPAEVVPTAPVAPAPAPAPAPPVSDPLAGLRAPPAEFIDLRRAIPEACFSIGYHLPTNFTGHSLPGYGAPGAWALPAVAGALSLVQKDLSQGSYKLVVYDAYRPVRASRAMVAWATRTGRLELFAQGYIARRSGHNHGHTVDVGLADAACAPIDMGTPWDALVPESRTRAATGLALENRLRLQSAMRARGFTPYFREWWHFTLPVAESRPRDVPYGCGEREEGAFTAPAGWEHAGWVPSGPVLEPCSPR